MKKILILLVLAGLFGCSSIKTAFDYDRQADFTKYKTYAFTEDDLAQTIGELNRDRIISAIENELNLKGFTKSENPDALINVFIKAQKKVDVTANTTGGYGARRYGYGGGYTTTSVDYNEYTEGTMLISLIDNGTQKIVWEGSGTKTLVESSSIEKREKSISSSVALILKNYPPLAK